MQAKAKIGNAKTIKIANGVSIETQEIIKVKKIEIRKRIIN